MSKYNTLDELQTTPGNWQMSSPTNELAIMTDASPWVIATICDYATGTSMAKRNGRLMMASRELYDACYEALHCGKAVYLGDKVLSKLIAALEKAGGLEK